MRRCESRSWGRSGGEVGAKVGAERLQRRGREEADLEEKVEQPGGRKERQRGGRSGAGGAAAKDGEDEEQLQVLSLRVWGGARAFIGLTQEVGQLVGLILAYSLSAIFWPTVCRPNLADSLALLAGMFAPKLGIVVA